MKNIKAVIFDWAGTTVDYGSFAPVAVFLEIFNQKGISVTMEEARRPMGMLKKDHIREMCKMESIRAQWEAKYDRLPNESDIEELYQDFEPLLFKNLSNYSKPLPGVVEAVKWLRSQDVKIGSTTGYTRAMVDVVAELAKKQGYQPDYLVASDEVPEGRPAPYMCYKNALALECFPFSQMVKVGDTISDIKEGVNAGMWSIGVLLGGSQLGLTEEEVTTLEPKKLEDLLVDAKYRFKSAGAHYVIRDMSELPALLKDIDEMIDEGFLPDQYDGRSATNMAKGMA